jgi:hypothetical protein
MGKPKSKGGRAWRKRECSLPRELVVGDRVRWVNRIRYHGTVVQVIEPDQVIHLPELRFYGSRPERSYLIEVRITGRKLGRTLWPRVHYLHLEE